MQRVSVKDLPGICLKISFLFICFAYVSYNVKRQNPESKKINDVIMKGREELSEEIENLKLEFGLNTEELLMENGGKPVISWLVTSWRSGSTFLGQLITSHPSVYYHYEPLLQFRFKRVKDGDRVQEGVRVMTKLFNCDYSGLENYLQCTKEQPFFVQQNTYLWSRCNHQKDLCWDSAFLHRYCSLFPFQATKTVRMRLSAALPLIQDENLNLRMIYLVRDPRGTLNSRKYRDWCHNEPDCNDPRKHCADLVSDYHASRKILTELPDKLRVVRYEDFSIDPAMNAPALMKFLRYSEHPQVDEFIKKHTGNNQGGVGSTFRKSKTTPFKWKNDWKKEQVLHIQESCKEAMDLWGYKLVGKDEDMRKFDPVINLGNWSLPLEL